MHKWGDLSGVQDSLPSPWLSTYVTSSVTWCCRCSSPFVLASCCVVHSWSESDLHLDLLSISPKVKKSLEPLFSSVMCLDDLRVTAANLVFLLLHVLEEADKAGCLQITRVDFVIAVVFGCYLPCVI